MMIDDIGSGMTMTEIPVEENGEEVCGVALGVDRGLRWAQPHVGIKPGGNGCDW